MFNLNNTIHYFLVQAEQICVGVSVTGKHSDKYIFYTLRFDCSFAAANTIKPQLL